MISLKESILSSSGAGKKAAIFRSLAKLLKGWKTHYEYSSKNTERVCIPHEGLPYINDVFRFGFIKTKLKEHQDDIKNWLKSISYKSDTKDDIDLFAMEDFKYYQSFDERLNSNWEMYIFKVDNTAVFIEITKLDYKYDNYYELYVFGLDINRKATYIEDWKPDQTFVSIINNEMK